MRSVRLHVCAAIVFLLGSTIAKADPDAAQAALVNQLFDDAQTLVAGDRALEACPFTDIDCNGGTRSLGFSPPQYAGTQAVEFCN